MGDLLIHPKNHYPGLSDRAVELLTATLFETEKLCEAAKQGNRNDLNMHARRLQTLAELLADEA